MTDNNHPITPPPELVKQWESTAYGAAPIPYTHHIARCAARWGADQELEACCEWIYKLMDRGLEWSMDLRIARRPRPLSLREEALETLRSMQIEPCWINGINTNTELMSKYDILRRALESLPE